MGGNALDRTRLTGRLALFRIRSSYGGPGFALQTGETLAEPVNLLIQFGLQHDDSVQSCALPLPHVLGLFTRKLCTKSRPLADPVQLAGERPLI